MAIDLDGPLVNKLFSYFFFYTAAVNKHVSFSNVNVSRCVLKRFDVLKVYFL